MTESTTTWEGHVGVRSVVMLKPKGTEISGCIWVHLGYLGVSWTPPNPPIPGLCWCLEFGECKGKTPGPIVPFTFTLGSRWSFRIQLLSCHEWTSKAMPVTQEKSQMFHPGLQNGGGFGRCVFGPLFTALEVCSHLKGSKFHTSFHPYGIIMWYSVWLEDDLED